MILGDGFFLICLLINNQSPKRQNFPPGAKSQNKICPKVDSFPMPTNPGLKKEKNRFFFLIFLFIKTPHPK